MDYSIKKKHKNPWDKRAYLSIDKTQLIEIASNEWFKFESIVFEIMSNQLSCYIKQNECRMQFASILAFIPSSSKLKDFEIF